MRKQGVRPRFKFGLERPGRSYGLREVLPFRRNWIAIAVLAAFDLVFLIPAITTFRQAAGEWSRFDSLFDLVGAVFLTAWLMGWSIAPLLMTTILVLMLFGREVLKARPGAVEVWIGIPGLGFAAVYDPKIMRNLRREQPPPKSGTSWRGSHLVFDYGANLVNVGSALDMSDVARLESRLETATGTRMRRGEAAPEELEGDWERADVVRQLASISTVSEAGDATDAESATETGPESSKEWKQPGALTASAVLLVLANLVPVAGAAFLGWSLSDVMVLYWAESAIIGFYNVCKIILIGRWFALLAGPFFMGHFGGFMAVHFLFIYTLFVKGIGADDAGGDLGEVWALFAGLWPALAALFISHGYSFVTNFLGRQEYRSRTVGDQMSEPYSRIVFMHLVLIFGGFLVMLLGDATPVLVIVIVLKIWFDLRAHRKEHRARSPKTPADEASG
jgi:hypothetical protein